MPTCDTLIRVRVPIALKEALQLKHPEASGGKAGGISLLIRGLLYQHVGLQMPRQRWEKAKEEADSDR